MNLHIRPARTDEWQEAKRLRLEMLADTPIAYSDTVRSALTYTDNKWQRGSQHIEADNRLMLVVADENERLWGQCLGCDDPHAASIASVYLSPEVRGCGLLEEMVELICQWLISRGHTQVNLLVHQDNHRAQHAYAKLGFKRTGRHEPWPLHPAELNLEYSRSLDT